MRRKSRRKGAGSRRRRVALRYKQLSEVKRGRSAWHTPERVTPYGARLIITQICSSFTGRQHTSRAFACPRRYTCNTCRACPFSCTRSFTRSLFPSLLSLCLSLSLSSSLSLSGAHSNRYNFADLTIRSDLCICHVCEIRLMYTEYVKLIHSLSIRDFLLNFKLIFPKQKFLLYLLYYFILLIHIFDNKVLN